MLMFLPFPVCWRGRPDQVDPSYLRRRTPADRGGITPAQQTHQHMVRNSLKGKEIDRQTGRGREKQIHTHTEKDARA